MVARENAECPVKYEFHISNLSFLEYVYPNDRMGYIYLYTKKIFFLVVNL